MKTSKIEKKVELVGGITVGYSIVKKGQEHACKGDAVMVELTMYLPCDANHDLMKELQFGRRLMFGRWWMKENWGYYDEQTGLRYDEQEFTSATYKEAFIEAQNYATAEIEKLETKLQERAKALEIAEDSLEDWDASK
jgi:hypothetical protein